MNTRCGKSSTREITYISRNGSLCAKVFHLPPSTFPLMSFSYCNEQQLQVHMSANYTKIEQANKEFVLFKGALLGAAVLLRHSNEKHEEIFH